MNKLEGFSFRSLKTYWKISSNLKVRTVLLRTLGVSWLGT